MQEANSLRKIQFGLAGLLAVAVAAVAVIFATESRIASNQLALIKGINQGLSVVGNAQRDLAAFSGSLHTLLLNPESTVHRQALTTAENNLSASLRALLKEKGHGPDFQTLATKCNDSSLKELTTSTRKLEAAVKSDPTTVPNLLATSFAPSSRKLESELNALRDQVNKNANERIFEVSGSEMTGLVVTGVLLLVLLAWGAAQWVALQKRIEAAQNAARTLQGAQATAKEAEAKIALLEQQTRQQTSAETAEKAERARIPLVDARQIGNALLQILTHGANKTKAGWRDETHVQVVFEVAPAEARLLKPLVTELIDEPSSGPADPPATNESRTSPSLRTRIMIVEPDPVSRHLAARLVTKEFGYEAQEVASGGEALDAMRNGLLPAMVLAEIGMPGEDAFRMLHQMRNDARLRVVPVTFFGNAENTANLAKASELHGTGRLLTPFVAEEVWEEIHRVLSPPSNEGKTTPAAMPEGSYAQLVESLTEEIAQTATEVRIDLTKGNRRSALARIDGIRGAAMNLGDQTIIAITKKLEKAIEGGDFESIMPELESLEKENERVKGKLAQIAAGKTAERSES